MSLPTASSLPSLDVAFGAEPFCAVTAKVAVTTAGLDTALGSEPFYAQGTAGGGGGGGGAGVSVGNFLIF